MDIYLSLNHLIHHRDLNHAPFSLKILSNQCHFVLVENVKKTAELAFDEHEELVTELHKIENLKKMVNEIFGENNFIANIIWERSFAPINLKKHFVFNLNFTSLYYVIAIKLLLKYV